MKRIFCLLAVLFCTFLLLDVSAQGEYATPKSGEGISSFLERNKRPGKAYYNEFMKLNEKRLRGKEELRLGVKYVLPPLKKGTSASVSPKAVAGKKRVVRERLFGKKLADVPVTSNRLQGACFYVVSGHGGPDPGAIGKIGKVELHEDEYAYDVALRLARNLMQEGAEVHIIIQDAKDGIRDSRYLSNSKRETCMGDAIPLNQVARLQQRCDAVNRMYRKDKSSYKRAVFIHVDSRARNNQTDVYFYHAPGSSKGKQLAREIQRTFRSKYDRHQPNRGFDGTVSERNLFVLRNTTPVAVFLEVGNIQNAQDQKRLVIADNRQALANWITLAIEKDYRKR